MTEQEDRLARERKEIAARVARFKATQEKFKREQHPFDAYDRLKEQVERNEPPKPADNFRWRYYGLFYVAPAQDSYMCRLRIPNGVLKHWQFAGVADLAERCAGPYAHVTTRANLQIREIAPKHATLSVRGGIGTFTPAAADPRLAAVLARSGLGDSGFRFTPSDSRNGTSRAVTVAVRAHTTRGTQTAVATAQPASVALTPIAYNLGVSVGWTAVTLPMVSPR